MAKRIFCELPNGRHWVVWRGVAWHGVVWSAVVWCSVMRCRAVQCGVAWRGMAWHGVWCRVRCYGVLLSLGLSLTS